jgi:hypothetical protein
MVKEKSSNQAPESVPAISKRPCDPFAIVAGLPVIPVEQRFLPPAQAPFESLLSMPVQPTAGTKTNS